MQGAKDHPQAARPPIMYSPPSSPLLEPPHHLLGIQADPEASPHPTSGPPGSSLPWSKLSFLGGGASSPSMSTRSLLASASFRALSVTSRGAAWVGGPRKPLPLPPLHTAPCSGPGEPNTEWGGGFKPHLATQGDPRMGRRSQYLSLSWGGSQNSMGHLNPCCSLG